MALSAQPTKVTCPTIPYATQKHWCCLRSACGKDIDLHSLTPVYSVWDLSTYRLPSVNHFSHNWILIWQSTSESYAINVLSTHYSNLLIIPLELWMILRKKFWRFNHWCMQGHTHPNNRFTMFRLTFFQFCPNSGEALCTMKAATLIFPVEIAWLCWNMEAQMSK